MYLGVFVLEAGHHLQQEVRAAVDRGPCLVVVDRAILCHVAMTVVWTEAVDPTDQITKNHDFHHLASDQLELHAKMQMHTNVNSCKASHFEINLICSKRQYMTPNYLHWWHCTGKTIWLHLKPLKVRQVMQENRGKWSLNQSRCFTAAKDASSWTWLLL